MGGRARVMLLLLLAGTIIGWATGKDHYVYEYSELWSKMHENGDVGRMSDGDTCIVASGR